jgi:hypothetical protein
VWGISLPNVIAPFTAVGTASYPVAACELSHQSFLLAYRLVVVPQVGTRARKFTFILLARTPDDHVVFR